MFSVKNMLAVFVGVITQYRPELLDDKNFPRETLQEELKPQYDFIIVGAGAAGSVLGNRLSEIEDWNVLILESGGDETVTSKVPLFHRFLRDESMIWPYKTVYQENACQLSQGRCTYPLGRLMGGSTSINAMLYARGSRHDYDEWEKMGCEGWSYKDVLTYFKKSESMRIPELKNSIYHGKNGPLIVQRTNYQSYWSPHILEAAEEIGIPRNDYNGENLTGVDIPQVTVNGDQRWSASSAYLSSVRNRSNLSISKNSFVTKILIDKETKEARGVEFEQNGTTRRVYASKEVILSAGAVNSPKLLMLSGIGPKDQLIRHGIDVLADLPVGNNLQDHSQIFIPFALKGKHSIDSDTLSDLDEMVKFAKDKQGAFTYNGCAAMVFLNVEHELTHDPPDTQLHFFDMQVGSFNNSLITLITNIAKPESKGTVTLKNGDAKEPPLIDPKYLTVERDKRVIIKGVKTGIRIMNSSAFAQYEPKMYMELSPNCKGIEEEEALLNCLVTHYSGTLYHPAGTARMGPANDPESVVDSQLRVIGTKQLRVIDASVMPKIVRANTNAATIMIAEKASDLIKTFYKR